MEPTIVISVDQHVRVEKGFTLAELETKFNKSLEKDFDGDRYLFIDYIKANIDGEFLTELENNTHVVVAQETTVAGLHD